MVEGDRGTDPCPSRAGSLPLIAGVPALDFANTASGRGGPRHREHLCEPAHVIAWAAHAGVLDDDAAAACRALLEGGEPEMRALLRQALSLREAVHRSAAAVAALDRPDRSDLDTIADIHAATLRTARLDMNGQAFWRWAQPSSAAVLGPIAFSAVELLMQGDRTRIKQCPGDDCGWVFLDTSKNRSRRWCEMQVCGNRAKARRHYERRVGAGS